MPSPSRSFLLRAFRALLVPLLLGGAALTAFSQTATQTFDIPAGKAEATLKVFADQARTQFFFSADKVSGARTAAVKGEFLPIDALDVMLKDTGLVAVRDEKTGTLSVRRDAGPNAPRVVPSGNRPENGDVRDGVIRLETYEVFGSKLINSDLPRTRDDVQPYVVFGREVIDASMATNLDEFFRSRLPMNQSGLSAASLVNSGTVNLRGLSGQTLILLDGRRLPPRPLQGADSTQGDFNGIPIGMIERIEILPSTASGIYGGGATGGVINIITRKDYSGVELSLNYQSPIDTDAGIFRAELNGTLQLEGGKTMLTLNYSRVEGNRLLVQDRDLTNRGRDLLLRNNPASFYGTSTPPIGYTTNIRSQTGANLVLKHNNTPLNAAITYVPVGYAGPATDNGTALVANAGRYNLDLPNTIGGRLAGLQQSPEQEAFGFSARRRFGSKVELLLDASRFDNRGYQNAGTVTSSALLPATAPNNPFTTPVIVSFPTTGLDVPGRSRSLSERFLVGAVVRLPADWSAGLDYVWSQAISSSVTRSYFLGDPDGTGPGAGFPVAIAAGTVDVMRDINLFPLNYDPYVMPFPDYTTRFALRADEVTLRASGPVYQLPGGDVTLSTSVQHRKEELQSGVRATATVASFGYLWDPPVGLTSRAYVAELRIPVFGQTEAAGWRRSLEVQVAVRRDEATASGLLASSSISVPAPSGPFPTNIPYVERDYSATKSTLGFKYSPVTDIAVRASWGTGFLTPSIRNLSTSTPLSIPMSLTDPRRGSITALVPVTLLLGGNPDVRPEESESYSGGMIFTPRFVKGLRVSVDYTRIIKTDEISGLLPDQMLLYEDRLPGLVERAPLTPADQALGYTGGVIQMLDFRAFNVAGKRVTAWDFQVDYTRPTETLGEFQAYAVATYQPDLETRPFADIPYAETGGDLSALPWRGNVGLNWKKGRLSLGWNMQYFDTYLAYSPTLPASSVALVVTNQGGAKIPAQTYHDFQVRYEWGAQSAGWRRLLANTQVTVGVQNVFNTRPPALATTTTTSSGSFSHFGDPRLARYTLNFRKRF